MNWNGRLIVINDIENLQEMPWDNYLDFFVWNDYRRRNAFGWSRG